jgi:16S rRNA (cytosine967-C5)-methyltransferase
MDMKNKGRLVSLDLHESKLSLVKSGAERLGIEIVEAAVHNGSSPREDLIGKADRVLSDVPCSGLGVIAKKPDLRYKSPDDIDRLPEVQKRILESSSKYVKSGGILVYSTCTVNKRENEDVVSAFLTAHPEFSLCEEGMRTFFPDTDRTDGFFVAKMKKTD